MSFMHKQRVVTETQRAYLSLKKKIESHDFMRDPVCGLGHLRVLVLVSYTGTTQHNHDNQTATSKRRQAIITLNSSTPHSARVSLISNRTWAFQSKVHSFLLR